MQRCSSLLAHSLSVILMIGRMQHLMHCSPGPPSDGQPLVYSTAALTGLQLPWLRRLPRAPFSEYVRKRTGLLLLEGRVAAVASSWLTPAINFPCAA